MKAPYVLKADGLAAGKGVVIPETLKEAEAELEEFFSGKFGEASKTVLIEEFMRGQEASFFAISDGKTALPLTHGLRYGERRSSFHRRSLCRADDH